MFDGLILCLFLMRYHIVAAVFGIFVLISLPSSIKKTYRFFTQTKVEFITDYSVTSKEKDTSAGEINATYSICVKHGKGTYFVDVPYDVYEDAKVGPGQHLKEEKLCYILAENKIVYMHEYVKIGSLLYSWCKIVLFIALIFVFHFLGMNQTFHWQ